MPAQRSVPAIDANLSNVAEELREAIEKQRGAQAEGLIKIAEQLDYPGVKISNYIAEGSPAKEILERAKQSKPDMVVLGSHSRERLSERVRGTVADRVLRHANTSVLMLPAGAIDGDS